MTAYYNEIDEYAAQWLRNLIAAGHIAPGDVDTRSITEVHPDDIKNYTQCHFFAGIGVWSYALRRAGWPDSRPVWTGSCPCQPFSTAGKGAGFDDERHLWPVFGSLIRERRPPTVFGEQVASKDADAWIDLVQADLESMGYAVGAVPFPAAGVGAPHIRDRLYWMARDLRMGDSGSAGLEGHHRYGGDGNESGRYNAQSTGPVGATGGFSRVVFAAECDDEGNCPQCGDDFGDCECIGPTEDDVEYIWIDGELYGKRLADTDSDGCQSRIITAATVGQRDSAVANGGFCGVADPMRQGLFSSPYAGVYRSEKGTGSRDGKPERFCDAGRTSPLNGFWRNADWLLCRDGKWRPVEPGTFPLAHGITSRLVYTCAKCKTETVKYENLRTLRKFPAGLEGLRSEAILFNAVLREVDNLNSENGSMRALSGAIQVCSGVMQSMQCNGSIASASHRQESKKQRARQYRDFMSKLSCQRASSDRATNANVQGMPQTISSPQMEEQYLFCPVCAGMGPHKCQQEMGPQRNGRLRAYGNAICAEAAVEFIKIAMEYRP